MPSILAHLWLLFVSAASSGFLVSTDPKCRFETLVVDATVISTELIQCTSPPNPDDAAEAWNTRLEVSLNGIDYTRSRRVFTYYDAARVFVSLLEPEGGPIAGGTEITVHGSSFRRSETLRCTWDDNNDAALKVNATFVSYSALRCISPRLPEFSGPARTVEVALDDMVFTSGDRPFNYYEPGALAVSAVEPRGGPIDGGTLIEVIGSGFAKLGGAVTHGSGVFVNDSWAAQQRHSSAGTFCKFSLDAQSEPLPINERPLIEGGLARARRRLRRGESAFTPSSTPTLGAHSAVVQATWVSGTLLRCRSPSFYGSLSSHRVTMRVHATVNGEWDALHGLSTSDATFTMYDPQEARITSLSRTGGPVEGGTHVEMSGKLFSDFTLGSIGGRAHLLRCRFGAMAETLATRTSDTRVSCLSPRVHGFGHQQSVRVHLTLNGQESLEGPAPTFVYYPRDEYFVDGTCRAGSGESGSWSGESGSASGESGSGSAESGSASGESGSGSVSGSGGEAASCANNYTGVSVVRLEPYGGPTSGGTQVIVRGRHFGIRGPAIECAFGSLSRVVGTFLNESAVRCVSPAAPPISSGGFVDYSLELTLNGESNFLTQSKAPFAYYEPNATLAVTSIYPRAAPKAGGTTITVSGSGFRVLGGHLRYSCQGGANGGDGESRSGSGGGSGSGSGSGGSGSGDESSSGSDDGIGDDGSSASGDGSGSVETSEMSCTAPPPVETVNEGLQCLFGDLPAMHAYLVADAEREASADPRVGDRVVCTVPELTGADMARLGLNEGDTHAVCLEVTLNGDRKQATDNCQRFTFYDA